jgi:hypothetical protein
VRTPEIIEAMRGKLRIAGGRHLYGVVGSYDALASFARELHRVRVPDGDAFPEPLNVNQGILGSIPDDEFKKLVEKEPQYPAPTRAHVKSSFEDWLRARLRNSGLLVLANLELLFAYQVDLALMRDLATDDRRIIMLLPGRITGGDVIMFPEWKDGDYRLPTGLIAADHRWEIKE